jgi:hypothetical protein
VAAKIIAIPAKPLQPHNARIAAVITKQAWLDSIHDRTLTYDERNRLWSAYSQAARDPTGAP